MRQRPEQYRAPARIAVKNLPQSVFRQVARIGFLEVLTL
jgi:hypothetical protein